MPTVTYASETSETTPGAPLELELLDEGRCHVIEGPYGALVATMAEPSMAPQARSPSASSLSLYSTPVTRLDRARELLELLPVGVWKRLALYTFLFLVFGNLVRSRGLALSTNLAGVTVVVISLVALLSVTQRNP